MCSTLLSTQTDNCDYDYNKAKFQLRIPCRKKYTLVTVRNYNKKMLIMYSIYRVIQAESGII